MIDRLCQSDYGLCFSQPIPTTNCYMFCFECISCKEICCQKYHNTNNNNNMQVYLRLYKELY